jgi:hypothetical protein
MQKAIAYFFLLITVNVVFFHPMHSVDPDKHLLTDPVNSITEFVVEVCLNIEDVHPGDEREAESAHFNTVKLFQTPGASAIQIVRKNFLLIQQVSYAHAVSVFIQDFIRIATPPPELIG